MMNLNVTSLSTFVSALGAYYGEYGISYIDTYRAALFAMK